MGLFKEVNCSYCGQKTNLLTRTKLIDGNYVCSECKKDIPGYIMGSVKDFYDLDDFKVLKNYIAYSENQLKAKFEETAHYGEIHMDEINRIFYVEGGLFERPLYLEFINVSSFDMDYQAEEVKESVFGDKVYGDVILDFEMAVPHFMYSKAIAVHVKAKAKTNFLGTKVRYDLPKGMEEFVVRFMTCWNEVLEEYTSQSQDTHIEMDEIEKAKVLFMLDDIDDITLEDIKEQRNRLIRMFHPDTGSESDTKYAQKINNAYEILKNAIGK